MSSAKPRITRGFLHLERGTPKGTATSEMAARLNGAHQADVRLKIKTSQLINRLQDFALENKDPKTSALVEIDPVRLKAIEVLLRKALPDLSSVTLGGAGENGEHLVTIKWSDGN